MDGPNGGNGNWSSAHISSSGWAIVVSPRSTCDGCLRERLHREDVVDGRWAIETRQHGRPWEVIVEPYWERQLLVVVTAYPVWE